MKDLFFKISMSILLIGVMSLGFTIAVTREIARQDAVLKYNCQYYGEQMNLWAISRGHSEPCVWEE